jgi:CubicO group peptidase (beta-lactamase class C family)
MQSRRHLLAMCSVLLIAALLAACAAPVAAPAPPADTPVPPTAAPDPVAVVQAWVEAINNGDIDAALALMTDDIDFTVWEYRANGKDPLRQWILDWWVGLDTKYLSMECQPQENQVSCNMNVVDGCIAAFGATEGLPTKVMFVVQPDGKISKVAGGLNGARWNDYFGKWSPLAQTWMRVNRTEELARINPDPDRKQAGELQIKLCRDYETATKTQEPATAAAAQALVNALNSGDTDAALALFTQSDETKFRVMSNEVIGADQMGAMFTWLAGKGTQLQITDCKWQGIGTQCSVSLIDGCISASGADDGLQGRITFYSMEDGTLRHVIVMPTVGRKAYETWLEAETAWAAEAHADELAQTEGYSKEAGAMAVKLCEEYAVAPKLDVATAAKIETLVGEIMANGQVPGAAVGIVKDGELVYAKGFGVTELGSNLPVTPDSIFHMGSVAKTATAVAIMQLVEAGKIDLDAPVTEYLPDFTLADPNLGEVTIRRLLSHTAGMPDPIDWLAEYQDENLRSDDAALDDYVRSLGDQSLTYQPGEDWAYSNTGFDILGDVVATVSGQSFEDYLQANVLTPLGMANSSYLLSDLDPAKLAAPHMYDKDGNAKTLDFYPYTRAHAPSGAFYSSVHDMARFAIANMNQGELDGTRVLPASAYEEMWAPQAATTWAEAFGPQVANYGLGWFVGEFNGHPLIGNYGTEFGFQSHFGIFLDDGMAVIALVNLFDPEAGSFYAYDIGNGVAEALLGVEAEPAIQP